MYLAARVRTIFFFTVRIYASLLSLYGLQENRENLRFLADVEQLRKNAQVKQETGSGNL